MLTDKFYLEGWCRSGEISSLTSPLSLLPSFFDMCVLVFITILPLVSVENWDRNMVQGIIFVFGTIFLMGVGFMLEPRRHYRSIALTVLVFISFIHVFWHSFIRSIGGEKLPDFLTFWASFSLLAEGFMYIFFGALLIKTIVENAKNYGWYYIPILYYIGVYFHNKVFDIPTNQYFGWSMSPIMACGLATIIVLFRINKKVSLVAIIPMLILTIVKWKRLVMKWGARPVRWWYTILKIRDGWFLGTGFDDKISAKDGFVFNPVKGPHQGWGWRHNDLLELGEFLGVIAMIAVVCFIIRNLYKAKISIAYYLAIAATLLCLFQRTMFFPMRGGIIVVIAALLILENRGNTRWANGYLR